MNYKSIGILTIVLILMGIAFSVKWNRAEVDWLNPTEFSSESYATGSIASSGLSSNDFGVEAYASPDLITSNLAWASAGAWQYGTFTANNDGELKVSVEYYLHQNLNTDVGTAQASSEALLWLARTDIDNIYSENLFAISNDITGDYGESGILTSPLFFEQGHTGEFSVGVWNEQGHTGEFSVGVWNETGATNPVPEPATVILLGCGLVGIAGFRRVYGTRF